MKQFLAVALGVFLFFACNQTPAEDTTTPPAETTPPPAEFADAKYSEIGKQGLASMASKDIDGWMATFADNAVYHWNNGDSLVGKPAISEYWKKRMTDAIETISFSNEIWLPVKINQPQSEEAPGNYVLGWYDVTAKYKSGKSMTQSIHSVQHFDANDKIDFVLQYLDRAPINAAQSK